MTRKKILVVEDDYKLNESICRIIRMDDFEMTSAFDSNQAISFSRSEKFDLILLDIRLPGGGDGDYIYSDLKERGEVEDTPVFIISGAAPDTINELIEKTGIAKDYVFIKPFDIERLRDKIKEVLSE